MAYAKKATMDQALRRIKASQQDIEYDIEGITGIDKSILKMSIADLNRLQNLIPKIQKLHKKITVAELKGLDYKIDTSSKPILKDKKTKPEPKAEPKVIDTKNIFDNIMTGITDC